MIIITGDSWGVGEWGHDVDNQYCLTGPGIGQYFSFHDKVINLSSAAADNDQSLTNLQQLLKQFTPMTTDTFYWIVTDPARSVTIDQFLNTSTTLYDQLFEALTKSLTRANKLAADYNIKIKLIGGLCDLEPQWVDQFSNLILRVPSWGKVINETYQPFIGWASYEKWTNLGKELKSSAPHLLEEYMDLIDQFGQKSKSMAALQGCGFSQHDCHPSRYGHRMLRDLLYPRCKKF